MALKADFEKRFARLAYHSFLEAIQGPCPDTGSLGISYEDYTGDTCLFAFNLSRALGGPTQALPPVDSGLVDCKIRFQSALESNVNAVF